VRFGKETGKKKNRTGTGMQKVTCSSRDLLTLHLGGCVRQKSQVTECIAEHETQKRKQHNARTPLIKNEICSLDVVGDGEAKQKEQQRPFLIPEKRHYENLQTNMEPKKWYLRDIERRILCDRKSDSCRENIF
jgi:hypothetical protein